MNSKHHGTSHLGRCNIDHLLVANPATATNPVAFENLENLTLAQLENLAIEIAAKHQLAMFHGDDERLTQYEQQMQTVAMTASKLADPDN